jgi:hypothetical protein
MDRLEKHLSGHAVKDGIIHRDANYLLLSLLTPVNHSRFRRQWKEFQAMQRSNGGNGCTVEAFVEKKRQSNPSHATHRTAHSRGATSRPGTQP